MAIDSFSGSESIAAQIRRLTWGYAPSFIMEAALRTRIFDFMDVCPRTVDELTQATGASSRGLKAILNALVAMGFITRFSSGQFALALGTKEFLVSSRQPFQGSLLLRTSERVQPWLKLVEAIKTGHPVLPNHPNNHFFAVDPALDLFGLNYPSARVLARLLKLSTSVRVVQVLDLGAGSGVWSIALAESSGYVRATVVDCEEMMPLAESMAKHHGVLDRFTFLPGDMHRIDFGKGYDIVVLGHVIHAEGERKAKILLSRVFDSLGPDGVVLIAEFLLDQDRTGPLLSALFAVSMLITTEEGDTFTFEEIAAWLAEIGFVDIRCIRVPGPSPLISARRPSTEGRG